MASDRVLIVRILGIGNYVELTEPLTLTSRAGLTYLPTTTLNGVITDMTAQLSSEISMFAPMGSDPTTSFNVLATAETMQSLLARGMTEVRSSAGTVVRTLNYVDANPNRTVLCDETTTLSVGDTIRIGGTAMLITAIPTIQTFEAICIFGSNPIPIAMTDVGGQEQGSIIYGMRYLGIDYQMGSVEQLPIVISSADLSASSQNDETVLFRGCVSKVQLNTSAYSANQISVECQSLMGMLINKPFRPTPNPLSFGFLGMPGDEDQLYDYLPPRTSSRRVTMVGRIRRGLQGTPYEQFQNPYESRIGVYQMRKEGMGALMSVDTVGFFGTDLQVRTTPNNNNSVEEVSNFLMAFNKGFFATNNGTTVIPLETTPQTGDARDGAVSSWEELANVEQGSFVGESGFVSSNVESLIFDLMIGTFASDLTGGQGAREANMSAWLPFGWGLDVFDIIDLGSLLAAVGTPGVLQSFPQIQYFDPTLQEIADGVVLPYMHAEVKTIGDVLTHIMKRLGCFMVYDRGKIQFGRWAGNGAWPVNVDDTALANPTISLSYDRMACLQTVEIEALVPGKQLAETLVRPVNNADRVLTGGAKTMRVGPFVMATSNYNQIESSNAFQNAVALIQKYSTAAAIVEVTYRDDVVNLTVGQEIFFSSAFIPSGAGTMGVQRASGLVLKANRAWQTPTTAYTLFLPGYLFAANRPSVISLSAKIISTAASGANTLVLVKPNDFTVPAVIAPPNAPGTDTTAFAQTITQNAGNPIPIEVLDEYGTSTGITSLVSAANIATDELLCIGASMQAASQDDIIILNLVTPDLNITTCWDAFQADAGGAVDGATNKAYPWVR